MSDLLKRIQVYVCSCALGDHLESKECADGDYCRWSDVEAVIKQLEARIAELEKPYVPFPHDSWRTHWANHKYQGLPIETIIETAVIARYNGQRGVK